MTFESLEHMTVGEVLTGIAAVDAIVIGVPAVVLAIVASAVYYGMDRPGATGRPRGWGNWLLVAVGCVAGLAVFGALLTWPLGEHGDWAPWQVALASAVAVAITATLVTRARWLWSGALSAATAVAVGVSVAWSLWAGFEDSTGLWGAGLVFLVAGVVAGLIVTGVVTAGVVARRRHRAGGGGR